MDKRSSVILNEVKNLMNVSWCNQILRVAQDDTCFSYGTCIIPHSRYSRRYRHRNGVAYL